MEKKINLGSKPFTIAFSGGCFSGKTSTMKALKSILEKYGFTVIILDELIRKSQKAKATKSIDEIRRDANEYFELQKEIIQEKIKQENKAFNSSKPIIYLFDRALTDSLFYYEFYVDKNNLHNKLSYFEFYEDIVNSVIKSFNLLDMLIEFKPLMNIKNEDTMRPAMINNSAQVEYLGIHRNNAAFFIPLQIAKAHKGYVEIDLSDPSCNNCIELIINKIQEVCKLQKR
jgi:hypothetical protein